MNAIEMLEEQHREVEKLFAEFEKASDDKVEIFNQIADALAVHATIEEKIFYPQTKTARTEDLLLEAVEEHLSAKRLIADIMKAQPGDAYDAKVKVLKEQIEHHVEEEEEELFPKVKKLMTKEELETMGAAMEEMDEELKAKGEPRRAVPGETGKPAPI